jgi:hypothetical protein
MVVALTQAASTGAGTGRFFERIRDESQGEVNVAWQTLVVNVGILKRRLFFPKSAFFAGWPV